MASKSKHEPVISKSPGGMEKAAPVYTFGPMDEIEHFIESWMPHGWLRPQALERPFWTEFSPRFELKPPCVDIIDRDGEIAVRVEIPGVEKKDLDISVNGRSLTIKGKSESKAEEEKGDYYRCEIQRGSFARTVMLPEEVDGAHTKATLRNGMLELTLPKLEKSHRLAIKVQ